MLNFFIFVMFVSMSFLLKNIFQEKVISSTSVLQCEFFL